MRSAELQGIVAMTRTMLAKAQAGEWAQVMRMELERQERVQAFFAIEVPEEENERVAQAIREILEMDRRMIDLGHQGQDALSRKINDLQAGRRAKQAYSACGG